VGININVVVAGGGAAAFPLFPLFLLLSALNFPAQPPRRMCNAHFLLSLATVYTLLLFFLVFLLFIN